MIEIHVQVAGEIRAQVDSEVLVLFGPEILVLIAEVFVSVAEVRVLVVEVLVLAVENLVLVAEVPAVYFVQADPEVLGLSFLELHGFLLGEGLKELVGKYLVVLQGCEIRSRRVNERVKRELRGFGWGLR